MSSTHADPAKPRLESRMRRYLALICAVLIATPGVAQPPDPQPSGYGAPIAVDDALALIRRGMEQSTAKGLKMAFAVVEPSGELVAFARMDDVPYASIRLAQQKARTSARLRMTTALMEERVQGGRSALLSSDEVIAVGGGVPILAGGRVVGALGVSGASAAEDASIAAATVARP
jgi:glc operon protein GlcG